MATAFHHVYGPVPSRRLGRSLGVDHLTVKTCSFDCGYCQLGHTTTHTIQRREYVPTTAILDEIRRKLATGDRPDYISFAGSGEPTLHAGLGTSSGASRPGAMCPWRSSPTARSSGCPRSARTWPRPIWSSPRWMAAMPPC